MQNNDQTQADLIQRLARYPRLGVVTDMDGTISHLVPTPDAATVTERSRELLAALHERIALVAVVTGRAVQDVQTRVGLPQLTYVGNHGLERLVDGQIEVAPEAQSYRPALLAALDEITRLLQPGMVLEDKVASASIHYRLVADPQSVYETLGPVVQDICRRHGLRYFDGQRIFEVRPPTAIDKGTAFERLITDLALDAAVFLGDDVTDADAMRAGRRLREAGVCYAVAVGVDAPGMPDVVRDASDVLVPDIAGVEAFLAELLTAVSASDT